MDKIFISLLKFYQLAISPYLGKHCRFYPSCSSYSIAVIEKYGVARGGFLTVKRLLKCHPWNKGGVDLP